MTDSLEAAARKAQLQAWAPYSNFRVGAALEAEDGLTICAERAALVSAVTAGSRRFRRVVIVSDSEPPAAPCGACRQVLAEFGTDLVVESVGNSGRRSWRLDQLLPDAFGPGSLA